MDVYRYNVQWVIPGAGPSVSVFHLFGGASLGALQTTVNGLRTAFFDQRNTFPDDVSITFPSEVSVLDVATGKLVGTQSIVPPAAVVGNNNGGWVAGGGVRLIWQSDIVRHGRKVRGGTYLVPTVVGAFTTSGTVSDATRNGLRAAFEAWRVASQTGARPLIYSRPKPGRPGETAAITNVSVGAIAATLRGRKY